MKIVLATYGSRGDVQPMLALALGLQSQGHTVLLVGPPKPAFQTHPSGKLRLPRQLSSGKPTAWH
ncbi:MAG: glycosyltransferase [Desulfobacteraceae bacterium]